ncbi:hypothetical protein RN001_009940 [Aquatica leii]|uniref:NTF2 domain-containing protein n=1 Tax=Aquatica leii TaxID=1421715 RepID=A0AAN7P5P3_9COLE|nr:hypothetical protein RN001_009940 [Aquatica leii]
MENSKAVFGIKQIFSNLTDDELLGLTNTVTQGLLKNKVETREEAVESILKYSSDFKSILKRKVLTRDLLFTYLHENDIPVSLPASKQELIDLICTHWNLKSDDYKSVLINNIQPNEAQSDIVQKTDQSSPTDVNALAQKFSEWFYTMMNSNEPIGSEHFWNDSNLKLNLLSAAQNVTEEIQHNPLEIVKTLFKTKMEHSLYFNPNCLKDGVQGRLDPHGLVAVLVCGTLHSNNLCVGVFEQVFMLARDPFSDNNWKIKSSELNLRSKDNVKAPPKLCDSNLTSNLLSLPSS